MKKSVSAFILMLLVIVLLVVSVCYGVSFGEKGVLKSIFDEKAIIKGLDLVGGSSLTYTAVPNEGEEVTDADIDAIIATLSQRAQNYGYAETQVVRLGAENRIRVDIPDMDDVVSAQQLMGATAQLEFFYLPEGVEFPLDATDMNQYYVDYLNALSQKITVLTGAQVKNAVATQDPQTFADIVALELDETARMNFAEATRITSQRGDPIYIMLDDAIISAPVANEEINSTECIISGNFDSAEAQRLASLISSGSLPCTLKLEAANKVGATLGDKAFDNAMLAGGIGILLVMLFMILVYRLPGVVSSIALVAYVAITAICVMVFKINLSLPAIAGIFLTIGMAVDANVVIFERIKEELSYGKSVKAAIKAGFDRAFAAVIDSNVTTLIAAVVLWIFGTGAVQGFAITLFIGVVISLFTALFVTKTLLNSLVGMGVTNVKLFGVKRPKNQ